MLMLTSNILDVTSGYDLAIYSYCNSKMVNSFKIKMVNMSLDKTPIKEQ